MENLGLGRDPGMDKVLDQFRLAPRHGLTPGVARREQVEAALRYLARGDTYLRLLMFQLMAEVVDGDYWRTALRESGEPYVDAADYLRTLLKMDTLKRSAIYQRIRMGKAMASVSIVFRDRVREHLAPLGMSKALSLAPLLMLVTDQDDLERWFVKAAAMTAEQLRKDVAHQTEAKARGIKQGHGVVCPTCHRGGWKKTSEATTR